VFRIFVPVLLAGTILSLPAMAQQVAAPVTTGKAAKDPNELVCEKQEVLGSRLAKRKICMTRMQWAEQRRSDQEQLRGTSTVSACSRPNQGC
jgi:invasion protein IalB